MEQHTSGVLIARLRKELGLTQKQLAEQLNLSDRTISKWERDIGYPDVTLLPRLAAILNVNIEELLEGKLPSGEPAGGNMKKIAYFVCPICGSITTTTGGSSVSCCGRKLAPLEPKKPDEVHTLMLEEVEDEWFLTTAHPMEKDHHISFVAFATGDSLQMVKLYPQWDLQVRIPRRRHGFLLFYCTSHGLFRQLI